jgi:ABC-type branched-subunit amino acid transport system ATPase component
MTALLRTAAVSKSFGGVQALNGATIEVDEGSIAGLIGPNGSGKTTLFNVITGYETVDGGEVYLGDKRITNAAPNKVFSAGIGRTFQLTRVFSRLTVMENMIVAAQNAEGRRGRLHNPLAGPWSCWSSPASRTTPARSPRPCPTASASCWSCPTC